MNPAAGKLIPATASNRTSPRLRPGQPSAAMKSASRVGVGAKLLVSCWNPPTALRAMAPSDLEQAVGELVAIFGPAREVAGEQAAAALDRHHEAVGDPALAHCP